MDSVHAFVDQLRDALPAAIDRCGVPVSSVIVDGSYARGDFLPDASDLDLTITVTDEAKADGAASFDEALAAMAADMPRREIGRKPLRLDTQWQTEDVVSSSGRMRADEWTEAAIPAGYPKLWLYAFDSIQHHVVLFGRDVTDHYTRLPPVCFIRLRLERLRKAVTAAADGVTDYDATHGTISQMRNAWELMRLICLQQGVRDIRKSAVLAFMRSQYPEVKGTELAWNAYRNGASIPEAAGGFRSLRTNLFGFSQYLLNRLDSDLQKK